MFCRSYVAHFLGNPKYNDHWNRMIAHMITPKLDYGNLKMPNHAMPAFEVTHDNDFFFLSFFFFILLPPIMFQHAYSRIPLVEDIFRGCSYYANGCDVERDENDRQVGIDVIRDEILYDVYCCVGEKCNSAPSGLMGVGAILVTTGLQLVFALAYLWEMLSSNTTIIPMLPWLAITNSYFASSVIKKKKKNWPSNRIWSYKRVL